MTQPIEKTVLRVVSLAGLAICVVLALWGWKTGILTSQERMEALVAGCGAAGALIFTVFQAVQVVVPILPGGLGCLVGVLMFGPVWGFVYNYVGICAGSLTIDRYSRWAEEKDRFSRLFALAIFLPVAPDDFLCYLAGTTDMTWRRYTAIILLGKPFAISLYSLGLTAIWQMITGA